MVGFRSDRSFDQCGLIIDVGERINDHVGYVRASSVREMAEFKPPRAYTDRWPYGNFNRGDYALRTAARQLAGIAIAVERSRQEEGFDQRRLADVAGVTQATISALESGSAWPGTRTLLQVLAVLEIRLTPEHRRQS